MQESRTNTKGSIVEVEVAGSLAKARVEEEVSGDGMEVTVSMWTANVRVRGRPYEEGHDTSQKIVRIFPRVEIIGGTREPIQRVTDATVEAASKNSNNPAAAAARSCRQVSVARLALRRAREVSIRTGVREVMIETPRTCRAARSRSSPPPFLAVLIGCHQRVISELRSRPSSPRGASGPVGLDLAPRS